MRGIVVLARAAHGQAGTARGVAGGVGRGVVGGTRRIGGPTGRRIASPCVLDISWIIVGRGIGGDRRGVAR